MLYKYPSTPHLPCSLGVQRDDRAVKDYSNFLGKTVVITEKMDGENCTMYNNYIHARSLDSRHHVSRDWVKSYHASISNDIPEGYRICGENLFAKHSIVYENLTSYFNAFSVWNEEVCLSWDETVLYCSIIGVEMVKVLYIGEFSETVLSKTIKGLDSEVSEGFVIRNVDAFNISDFDKNVAKFVRADHVQTNKHWFTQKIVPNKLVQ